ncbi:aminotransferase class I/II-fold pyridoxal phosphate-dependent enzyme [Nocardioides sp.]|uniref:aminotransferase class I/II-fold pyridoxal phosphate-dependent enzyme n=1 Tax=Nocardioides sp. TaxID=35761 RepID=UPI0025FACB1D|nr:aminotransferase class I/II-fold pyridoxal phosphate-dependent enzyme [Nocardioides sp.]
MSSADRERLVRIARRHSLLIIEDASYAYLAEDPPPPLAATAPDLTVYVSGLSKGVATGLRVGFLVAPDSFIGAMERAIRVTTWNTPSSRPRSPAAGSKTAPSLASKTASATKLVPVKLSRGGSWPTCTSSAILCRTSHGCHYRKAREPTASPARYPGSRSR